MEQERIQALESSFAELSESLGDLGDGSDIEELLPMFSRAGTATLIDEQFVFGITAALTTQVRTVVDLKRTLIEGSRMIGGEGEARRAGSRRRDRCAA
jgi:hypothetical protein